MSDDGWDATGAFHLDNTVPPWAEEVLPLFSCRGKTAIVTGAATGIGLAVARALAEAGANVAIWYNTTKQAPELARDIETAYGVKAKAYPVDVTDEQKVEKAVEETIEDFNGRLDIFVANAGITGAQGSILDVKTDNYRKVIATDLDSTFYCAKAAARHWKRQRNEGTDSHGNRLEGFTSGSFVATSSVSGSIVDLPDLQAAYCTAKAGIIHLCKCLAVEWVRFARANSISPGIITTTILETLPKDVREKLVEKVPMGREGSPNELKGTYLYLCSDASSYTTGVDIKVDGGYCLL